MITRSTLYSGEVKTNPLLGPDVGNNTNNNNDLLGHDPSILSNTLKNIFEANLLCQGMAVKDERQVVRPIPAVH